jgi:hypothetical protein
MLQGIILAVGFIATLSIVLYLFNKLTPDNAPENLAGYFTSILKVAIAFVVAIYVALFLVQILFT